MNPQRHNWTAIIGVVLTAASMYAFGIRYVVRLNEADEKKAEQIRALQSEVADLRREREKLSNSLTRIEVRLEGVGKELGEMKDDVKEVKGDVRSLSRRR